MKVTNTYNSKNELIKTVSDKEVNYTYNPEGKRIEKNENNNKIKYVYEGLDIILELDSNNNVIANNVYGLSLISRNSDKKGYYLYNGHGDTVTIVDNEQNEIKSYTYDEWGSIIEEVGEYDNPYRYAGYYYDEETGNYYLLSRYYNPVIARFIVEDTYRGEIDDPLSLNRYVYVVNNPLIYIDPEGNIPISFITGGIGGIWSGGSKIVSNIMNGKDWHEGVAGATIEGAITGFAIGTCGIKCAGIGNYIGNVSGQAVESWSTTGQIKINQKEAITHSVTTQVGAMVFGNPGMSYNYNIGEYISYYVLKGGITAASADMTYQFLDKGIIVDENNNIKGYDIESAINNYDITQTIRNGVIGSVTTPVIMGGSEFVVNKITNNISNKQNNVIERKVPNPDGRKGNPRTVKTNIDARDIMVKEWKAGHTGGANKPEEYIAPINGGRKGGNYLDLTFEYQGRTIRINTVDTLKDGITMTAREYRAAQSIMAKKPDDIFIAIPKGATKNEIREILNKYLK